MLLYAMPLRGVWHEQRSESDMTGHVELDEADSVAS